MNYHQLEVNGRIHILKLVDRNGQYYFKHQKERRPARMEALPNPNYKGTGMALCGILKKGETLEQWIERTR